ncbi:MAG: hypothetical protein MR037_02145, partial [Bacteroidales bacterium]|nr:hypothetical protein [Bacteroidales bacterium]
MPAKTTGHPRGRNYRRHDAFDFDRKSQNPDLASISKLIFLKLRRFFSKKGLREHIAAYAIQRPLFGRAYFLSPKQEFLSPKLSGRIVFDARRSAFRILFARLR